ncbi:MAG: TIR domain-containing protein [Clostridiaceae bacterium]
MEFRVFIGSSSENRHVVNKILKIISEIQPVGELTAVARPWYSNSVFTLGDVAIETVEREINNIELAIFVFADDDELVFRHNRYMCPRDNVVFEAGLFMGKLGRKKVILLTPKEGTISNGLSFKQLSDLAGLTVIPADIRDLPGGFSREVEQRLKETIVDMMNDDPRKNNDPMTYKLITNETPDPISPIKDYSKIIPKSLGGAKR